MSEPTTRLDKTLGLRSVVLFGLAYMTPIIVLGIFGVIAEASDGASAGSYLLATVAMLFTAISYGCLAGRFPVAGSAYTYVRRALDARLGFMVGWTVLLDYLFLPLVIWLIGGAYLESQFPGVPSPVWILLFVLVTTALNVLGLKVADRANFLLMAFQVLVLAFFVLLCVRYLVDDSGAGALWSVQPFTGDGGFSGIAAGAAIAAYSFLGFDAVSTLTEETHDARRTIPRAIVLVACIGGLIFVTVAYVVTLVEPGGTFSNADSLASDTAETIGGSLFGAVFLAGLIVAQFTSGLAAQASTARLLYAMGRDGVLPRALFGRLSARFHTPVANLVVCGLIGCLAIFLDVATSTSFINFGAFTAFTLVNVAVIAYFVRNRHEQHLSPLVWCVVPAVGAVIDVYLLTRLDAKALTLGGCWAALGLVYLVVLTRGFRQSPPEIAFDEDDAPVPAS